MTFPWSWTWGTGDSSPAPFSSESVFWPVFPSGNCFQGCNLERAMCCGVHQDGTHEWIPLGPLQKLKILVGGYRDLILQPPKTSLICQFPCLLHVPPTNLELSAFLYFLLAFCLWEPVLNFSQGTPEAVNQQPLFRIILFLCSSIKKNFCFVTWIFCWIKSSSSAWFPGSFTT